MDSKNIKIGIDLGTTNSELCISIKGNLEVIKNIYGDEFTPSILWVNEELEKIVGKRAYEKFYRDSQSKEYYNIKAEVKRLMGTSEKVRFDRLQKDLSPEEISSEILKSLKTDISKKYPDFNTEYAVITVPAYFSILQSEATKRAGELAGFKHVVLLQEPIAAAISYGFSNLENETWIVYDLGGGTFDVAIVNSKEGHLSVIAHNGDNFLGGKDFDNDIVNKIIIPKIMQTFKFSALSTENSRYTSIFQKFKYEAELAKKVLSTNNSADIEIYEPKIIDDEGKPLEITLKITRQEFEEVIKDKVAKTINLTKDTIRASGIDSSKIKKIVLVGGPTQIPYLRESLKNELKIEVDTSSDPLSAVARGACIFALSQNVPDEIFYSNRKEHNSETKILKLDYQALSSEMEENVYGNIEGLEEGKDYFVQIQSESNHFSSPKTKVSNGKFIKEVALEKVKSSTFYVYVFDEEGNIVKTSPDSFSITQGLSIAGAPISHSIGLVVAEKNEVLGEKEYKDTYMILFEKGSILPLKQTMKFKTAKPLNKKNSNETLDIIVCEGESKIPDRNTFICTLGIDGEELPFDLKTGTDIEVTIEINESREVTVSAYFPLIDKKYNARSSILANEVDLVKLEKDLEIETVRIEDVEENISISEAKELRDKLKDTYETIKGASAGLEEKGKAEKEVRELKNAIDEIQQKADFPKLITFFNNLVEEVKECVHTYSEDDKNSEFNNKLSLLETDGKEAVKNIDKRKLNQVIELLEGLKAEVLLSSDFVWISQLKYLASGKVEFTDNSEAQYFISKGLKAIEKKDMEEIKRCVRELYALISNSEDLGSGQRGPISGITK